VTFQFLRAHLGAPASLTALGFAALLAAVPVAARADGAPAPAPSPTVAPAGPAGASESTPRRDSAPPAATFGHLPIIDISPVFTQPLDYTNSSQLKGFQSIDFNGTVRIPVVRNFSLIFDRVIGGTLDVPLARVLIPIPGHPSEAVYPGVSRDIVLFYHGTAVFRKYLVLDVGDAFRHREYNSGGSGVSAVPFPTSVSSTEAHWAYAGLTYTTHPIAELFNTSFFASEQVEEQNVDHNVGILCTAALVAGHADNCLAPGTAGVVDEHPGQSKYYTTQQTVGLNIPLGGPKGALLSVQDGWGALSWYENAPFPYRYSGIEQAILSKRFNSVFSLALRARQYFQLEQGAPFPSPNVIHLGSVDVIGTFHVDTNSLFH
jgi:hypothetical protein